MSKTAFPHLSFAARSELGLKRKSNEDSFGTFPAIGVWCVADGMGGGDDGEIASAEVIQKVDEFCRGNPFPCGACYSGVAVARGVTAAVNVASNWIFDRAEKKGLKGCGSTFVAAVFDASRPERAIALHAGDSRLYRIRGRDIKQITKDHSAAELVGAKSDADLNPMFRGMILRAVGILRSVEVETTIFDVKRGDIVLICSDGLSKMVPDKKIVSLVNKCTSAKAAVDVLIDAAYKAGATDNVTVEIVIVGDLPHPVSAVVAEVSSADGDDPETGSTFDGEAAPFDSAGGTLDNEDGTAGTAVFGEVSDDTPSTAKGAVRVAAPRLRNPQPAFVWLAGLAAGIVIGIIAAVAAVSVRGCDRAAPELPQHPRQLSIAESADIAVRTVANEAVVTDTPPPVVTRQVVPPPPPPHAAAERPAPQPIPLKKERVSQSSPVGNEIDSAELLKSLRDARESAVRADADALNATAQAKAAAEALRDICRDKGLFGNFKEAIVKKGASCAILDNYASQLAQMGVNDNRFVAKACELVREVKKLCIPPDVKLKSAAAERLSRLDPTESEAYGLAVEIMKSVAQGGKDDG